MSQNAECGEFILLFECGSTCCPSYTLNLAKSYRTQWLSTCCQRVHRNNFLRQFGNVSTATSLMPCFRNSIGLNLHRLLGRISTASNNQFYLPMETFRHYLPSFIWQKILKKINGFQEERSDTHLACRRSGRDVAWIKER